MSGAPARRGGPSPWLRARTSVVDRVVALLLLPVLGPVIAYLAWRVRREDGPPSVIGLERVGADGQPFRMWKLRTMRVASRYIEAMSGCRSSSVSLMSPRGCCARPS